MRLREHLGSDGCSPVQCPDVLVGQSFCWRAPSCLGRRHWPRSGSPTHHLSPAPQDVFLAFHRNLDFVRKFMKPLLIGELAPEEPSQDHSKNVSGTSQGRRGGFVGGGGLAPRRRVQGVGQRSLYASPGGATAHHLGSGRTPMALVSPPPAASLGWPSPWSNSFPAFPPLGLQRCQAGHRVFPSCPAPCPCIWPFFPLLPCPCLLASLFVSVMPSCPQSHP